MRHTSIRRLLLGIVACAPLHAALAAEPGTGAPVAPGDPPIRKLDGHLVDVKGRGVYTWDGDKVLGQSTCAAQCRLLWPPITADDAGKPKGPFTIAMRPDGTRQWALRGRPLYRWTSDRNYGDAGGDGVAGAWHLVKVAGPSTKPAATDAAATPATRADAGGPDRGNGSKAAPPTTHPPAG